MKIQTNDKAVEDISRLPLPPVAPGLPILGNTLDLAQDILAYLVSQYHKLGPIFRVRALNREMTVMAGQEANLFISRESTAHFRSREFWSDLDKEMGATRSLISIDGPDHALYRNAQKDAYSKSFIGRHFPEVVAIAQQEALAWPLDAGMPGTYAMQRIVTEQLGQLETSFSPREHLDDLIQVVRAALLARVTRQRPSLILKGPGYRQAKARLWAFGEQVLDAHKRRAGAVEQPDLIDDILAFARANPGFLKEQDFMLAALGPFIAGLDTAASTLAFVLYATLKNGLVEAATAEADAAFADGVPTPDILRKMDVTHRIVMETLRRYPIAPAMQRTAIKTFAFGGYRVDEGTTVLLTTALPHFLPEFYPDPYQFDIDRFTPGRNENRKPGVFAPFGLGPHTCLGAGLAEVLIMLNAATLLHTVRLEMDPPDYELKIDPAPTQKPDKGFQLRVVERRHAPR